MLTRLLEKVIRISNMTERGNKVKEESLIDSIKDCMGYLVILYAYLILSKKHESNKKK